MEWLVQHRCAAWWIRRGPATISRNRSVCNVYVRGEDNTLWQRPCFNNSGIRGFGTTTAGCWRRSRRWGRWGPTTSTCSCVAQMATCTRSTGRPRVDGVAGSTSVLRLVDSRGSGDDFAEQAVCNIYVRGKDNALWQRPYFNNSGIRGSGTTTAGCWRRNRRWGRWGRTTSMCSCVAQMPTCTRSTGRPLVDGVAGSTSVRRLVDSGGAGDDLAERAVCNIYVRGKDNALWQRAYFNNSGIRGVGTTTAGCWRRSRRWGRWDPTTSTCSCVAQTATSTRSTGSSLPNLRRGVVRGQRVRLWLDCALPPVRNPRTVRIQLNPDAGITAATMDTLRTTWRNGILATWSNRFECRAPNGGRQRLTFDVQWVASNAHHVVGSGPVLPART